MSRPMEPKPVKVEYVGGSKTDVFFRVPYKDAHRIVAYPTKFLKKAWRKARYFWANVNPLTWRSYDYGYYVDMELMSVIEQKAVDSSGGPESS